MLKKKGGEEEKCANLLNLAAQQHSFLIPVCLEGRKWVLLWGTRRRWGEEPGQGCLFERQPICFWQISVIKQTGPVSQALGLAKGCVVKPLIGRETTVGCGFVQLSARSYSWGLSARGHDSLLMWQLWQHSRLSRVRRTECLNAAASRRKLSMEENRRLKHLGSLRTLSLEWRVAGRALGRFIAKQAGS